MLFVMHDDTVIIKDVEVAGSVQDPFWDYGDHKTFMMANLIVCIDLKTGETSVLKNRWGCKGSVTKE